MKQVIFAMSFALVISGNAFSDSPPNSVEIHNATNSEVFFLLNGESHSLPKDHSLRIPCYQNEDHSLAYAHKIKTLLCGEQHEIGE